MIEIRKFSVSDLTNEFLQSGNDASSFLSEEMRSSRKSESRQAPYWKLKHILEKDLMFSQLPSGKPICENLFFSISHSRDDVLIAWSEKLSIGIDIQFWEEKTNAQKIIERYFHPDDIEKFLELPEPKKKAFFLESWTKKEALLKASQKNFEDVFQIKLCDLSGIQKIWDKIWFFAQIVSENEFQASLVVEVNSDEATEPIWTFSKS